jgi:hypothetical protein
MTEVPSLLEPIPVPEAMLAAEVKVAPVHTLAALLPPQVPPGPPRPGPERPTSLFCRQPPLPPSNRRRNVIEHSRESTS